mgnify:CR=1 FL=1
MPHIIVEYTDTLNIDIPALLQDLHHDLAAREPVDINAIKTRAIPIKNCIVANDSASNAFIHIALKLLPGRSDDLKIQMTKGLHSIARKYANDPTLPVSVETITLEGNSYIK